MSHERRNNDMVSLSEDLMINSPTYTTIKSVKMDHEARKQSQIVILTHNPNQIQGHDNKDNNTDDETKDVEDNEKAQSIEYQNDLKKNYLRIRMTKR